MQLEYKKLVIRQLTRIQKLAKREKFVEIEVLISSNYV
jgi:hypothetical protein